MLDSRISPWNIFSLSTLENPASLLDEQKYLVMSTTTDSIVLCYTQRKPCHLCLATMFLPEDLNYSPKQSLQRLLYPCSYLRTCPCSSSMVFSMVGRDGRVKEGGLSGHSM